MQIGPAGLALHRMKTFLGKYTAGMAGSASLRAGLEHYKEPGALLDGFRAWADGALAHPSSPT